MKQFMNSSLLLMTLILAACNQAAQETPSSSVYSSEEERLIMEPIVASLRPGDRENVVYVRADGKVFSNNKELRQLSVYKAIDATTVVDANGNTLQVQALQPKPVGNLQGQAVNIPCTMSDGPYHRVNTKTGTSTTPYQSIATTITLPPPASITLKTYAGNQNNEATYAYLGGWGDSQNSAVDAGFVYSPVSKSWTEFIFVQGSGAYVTTKPGETVPPRLSSGDVPTEFYVPQDDKVALSATAVFTNGTSGRRTIVADAPTWKVSGIGNVLKYTTSITQPAGVNFQNGISVFGYEFKDLTLNNRLWSSSDTQFYTTDASGSTISPKDACDYPSDSTRILVNAPSSSNQRVPIKLYP